MVPDLDCHLDILSPEEEAALLAKIDVGEWETTLSRKVQQFGHRYNYGRSSENPVTVQPIPSWASELFEKCRMAGLAIPEVPPETLQVIVNHYEPGQGISAHVDDPVRFTNWVVTITLGSGCGMRFKEKGGEGLEEVYLPRRSAYLMRGKARYNWTHEIPARKSDKIDGQRVARGQRISVTFRAVSKAN